MCYTSKTNAIYFTAVKTDFPSHFQILFLKKQSCESENLWPLAIEVINKSMPSENCEKNNKDNED